MKRISYSEFASKSISISHFEEFTSNRDFEGFTSFNFTKHGKKRKIFRLNSFTDKVICDNIFNYLRDEIIPKHIYKKSVLKITKQIQNRLKYDYELILNADITSFFESIPHEQLLEKIKKLNDSELLRLVDGFLAKYKKSSNTNECIGLPTGINLSHALSELYLYEFETELKKYCKNYGSIYFYRYCDNFIVLASKSTPVSARVEVVRQVYKQLKPLKLRIRVDEASTPNEFIFLGYKHSKTSPTLSLSDKTINGIKGLITSRVLRCLFEYEKCQKSEDLYNVPAHIRYVELSINRAIKGYNTNWTRIEDINELRAYGISPLMSVINNHAQIIELEKWIGKIIRYFYSRVHELCLNFVKREPILMTEIYELYPFLRRSNLVSLRYWVYKYKRNYLNTAIQSHLSELRTMKGASQFRRSIVHELFKIKPDCNLKVNKVKQAFVRAKHEINITRKDNCEFLGFENISEKDFEKFIIKLKIPDEIKNSLIYLGYKDRIPIFLPYTY